MSLFSDSYDWETKESEHIAIVTNQEENNSQTIYPSTKLWYDGPSSCPMLILTVQKLATIS